MKMIHMECPGHPEATVEGYILDCELSYGQETNRPCIVICPGGGYIYCSPREAEPVALAYAAKGYHAFILRYSTGRNCTGCAPLQEIDWLIGYIRENAESWHIDPEKILTCGFSAGGHLALWAGIAAKNKPNGMILGYPATSAEGFMASLLMGKQEVSPEEKASLNLVPQISEDIPPVFMAATAQDGLTPYGALAIANQYTKVKRQYELHIFQHGPHGYSTADEVAADGSSQVLNTAYAQWLPLSVEWLKKTFGQPQFVDKSTSKIGQYLKELGIQMPTQKTVEHA